jgi:hypothetical protein
MTKSRIETVATIKQLLADEQILREYVKSNRNEIAEIIEAAIREDQFLFEGGNLWVDVSVRLPLNMFLAED